MDQFPSMMSVAEKILVLGNDPFVNTLITASINTHPDWQSSMIESLRSLDTAIDELSVREYEIILVDADSFSDSPLEILIRLKKVTRKTPVILLKQPGMEKTAISCLKNGAAHYLLKEKNWEEQIPAIMDLVLEEQHQKNFQRARVGQLEEENRRLREAAILDDHTQFYGIRHFQTLVGRELKRAARYGSDLCCLLLEIRADEVSPAFPFDEVMEQLSLFIRSVARTSDIWARLDENRVAALLPHTPSERANDAVRRIHSEIGHKKLVVGGREVPIHLRWGVSDYKRDKIGDEAEFLRAAEASLSPFSH